MTAAKQRDLSVYVHVPFCVAKCPYCDFVSATEQELGISPRDYFDLLVGELELVCREEEELRSRRLVTLYFGGGTPSLIEPFLYERFFERLAAAFPTAAELEWTVEVNPGTASAERLDRYIGLGVNRLSIGVQSFNDETLERLGRVHRSAEVREIMAWARTRAGRGPSVSIDLIFGAPEQTLEQWRADLEELVAARPDHCSIYGLTIHEGTPFHEMRCRGDLKLPDEETQREMYLVARRMLTDAGYEHYEISNYALPGRRSRHNERYWTGRDYLGLGLAAHSMIANVRWANPADMGAYRREVGARRLARRTERPPVGRARPGEWIMLGLRRLEGIDLEQFEERFGIDPTKLYAREIERLVEGGLLELDGGRMRLTEEGLLVADSVMAEFF